MSPAGAEPAAPGRSARRLLARWRVVLAGALVVELLAAFGGLIVLGPPRTGPVVADRPPPGTHRVQYRGVSSILLGSQPQGAGTRSPAATQAVRTLLANRAGALLRRDRAAFLATVDPDNPTFRSRQEHLFDNLAQVPLGSWSYQLDPAHGTPGSPALVPLYGDELWAPGVHLTYTLAGYDATPTVQPQHDLFVRHADRWYLTDDGPAPADTAAPGAGSVRNLWDYGPVSVLRAGNALVLGHPDSLRLMGTVLRMAQEAVPRVTRVWGPDWPQRVVALVPGSVDELSGLVEQSGDLSSIAAFASADVPDHGPPTGTRVVVNPAVFPDLSPFGEQIVLTHEITHVAARAATTDRTPDWLAEGFADYTAYRGTGVDVRAAAKELRAKANRGELPTRLPGSGDFAAGGTDLPVAYEQAWLACLFLAQRSGEQALVGLYHQVSAATGDPDVALDRALRDRTGLGTEQFVAGWRDFVKARLA